MTFMPLRTRAMRNGSILHVNDGGNFFASDISFVERAISSELTEKDRAFLKRSGHYIDVDDAFDMMSYKHNLARRWSKTGPLDYLILVPTLRCNLSCSYCQVSRVAERARGYDWSEETLEAVLQMLDGLSGERIKVEFQGGEPTLRPDLVQAVIDRCDRFETKQFVICTNLQVIGEETWELFDNENVFVSTSLDGTFSNHANQRTGDGTEAFIENLRSVIDRYGSHKISALPTIDPLSLPPVDDIIRTYSELGLHSIFLRPINYQGFARKRHSYSLDFDESWNAYHKSFVDRLIDINWADRTRVLEETYLSICLRRIFRPAVDRHVDLRNPNPLATDYLVVDYDGAIYPTDEARMLARSGVIDLRLGQVGEDWKTDNWQMLNSQSTNLFDPACSRCPYQAFCGRDIVDDLARYGSIEVPRTQTAFCRKHMAIFDYLFELIYRDEEKVRYSLSRWLRIDGTLERFGEVIT